MQSDLEYPVEVELESSDAPFDFAAFVALRRGISLHEAERLIEDWIEAYEPQVRAPHSPPTEINDDRKACGLRICA